MICYDYLIGNRLVIEKKKIKFINFLLWYIMKDFLKKVNLLNFSKMFIKYFVVMFFE